MVDINVASPGDSDVISSFPTDERASRAALLDLLSGLMFGCGTTGGSGNAQTLTISLTDMELQTGQFVVFIAGFTNTDAVTLRVNSLTAKSCYLPNNVAISSSHPGAITAGRKYTAVFDGTGYVILNPSGYMDQSLYDILWPIGATKLHGAASTPAVPYGVTATWVLESADDLFLRGTTGTPITVGGSFTTQPEGSHTHTYSGTTSGNSAAQNVESGGDIGLAANPHTHTFSGTTSAGSAHTHIYEPPYVTYRLYRRTA